ncbi:LamG-like jellyroll fold domain-containing protein [Cyclobacterium salsum]|uniref:LamG-like jellyroll fold domain-containing protein n=1 Tax=Cyclobacterium salsum TaxID=2666329 RepID=UPI001F244A73|nr:LamG-like jellyroll fold domain-containing protein [Cyclobacterium salsum]
MAWSTNLLATDYMVSGAGSAEVNGTYIPDGTNMDGNPRWKLSGGSYYLHSNMFGDWVINDYRDDAFGGFYVNWTSSDPAIPPLTGWEVDFMGTSPAPTVRLPGPGISYSAAIFTEYAANDGSIETSQPIIITHNNFDGKTFTGSNGDNFVADGKVIVTNLSTGLTAVITRTSATTLSVILTGNVTTHKDANDVLNLTFAFQDDAFSSGDASSENNATKNDLEINYFQEYSIGSSGDYASITAALSAFNLFNSDWNILNLAAETFTENNLNIGNLTVRGQGAGSTIVQAAASQGIANRGVFITSNTVVLENLTVRHGKTSLGGGINNKGVLTVNNCNISNNDANIGGGIFNQQPDGSENSLTINNSTIANNRSVSTSYGSAIILYGGDASCTMTNCTVFGNTSNTTGNEGALVGWSSTNSFTIMNSTISGNDAGLLSTYGGKFIVQNTIIAGNDSKDYRVLSSGTVTDNGYNIVESQTVSKFNNATDILYSHDYIGNIEGASGVGWNKNDASLGGSLTLSSTLADNSTINGTQTLALSSGSFAIDAGTASGASTTDQRGLYRNGATDIGAYEYGGLDSDPSNTTPIITGPSGETGVTSAVSINENATAVHAFSADETVTWSLGSTNDGALFAMDNSGNLVFANAPDYETPSSTLSSNTYVVAVIATNAANNSATQTLTITVVDISSTTFGTFPAISKQYFVGTYTIVPPTTNNTNPIVYTSDNTSVATISGSVITFTGVGTANITATQDADANYEGNTVSTLLTVLGKDLLSKYGGISSTDLTFTDVNGKVGGSFGVDKYGNIQDIYEDLVTSGLIMHLDAGNTASYSGTGNVWNDISGYGNHGTLVNNPLYNSSNDGNLVFNGSNNYINAPLTKTASCTFSVWAKSINTNSNNMLFNAGNNGSGPDLFFSSGKISWNTWDSSNNPFGNIPLTASNGNWHHYVVVNDAVSNTTKFYYDGVLYGTAVYKNASVSTSLYIGGTTSTYMWNGAIGNFQVHNRVLTSLEVGQNFNYLKSRYGL